MLSIFGSAKRTNRGDVQEDDCPPNIRGKNTDPASKLMLQAVRGSGEEEATHLVTAPVSFAEAFSIARSSAVTASRRTSTAAACFLSKKSVTGDSAASGMGHVSCGNGSHAGVSEAGQKR